MSIRDNYRQDLSDEEAEKMGWYGNFISVSMERTLVLYDDSLEMMEGSIPDVIFKSIWACGDFPVWIGSWMRSVLRARNWQKRS